MGVEKSIHNPTAKVGSTELKERAGRPAPLFVSVFCVNFSGLT